jgi:predicted DNA-binding transcriptional regulator AlpA
VSQTPTEPLPIEEVARLTGLSLSWLKLARQYGYGPPVVRTGRGPSKYPQDKLAAWVAGRIKMAEAPRLMYRQWLRDHGLTEVPRVQP